MKLRSKCCGAEVIQHQKVGSYFFNPIEHNCVCEQCKQPCETYESQNHPVYADGTIFPWQQEYLDADQMPPRIIELKNGCLLTKMPKEESDNG